MHLLLFPWLEDTIGELTEKHRKVISVLELTHIDDFVPARTRVFGRPLKERAAIACAFVAKAIYNMPTTRDLIDRLKTDQQLRLICGFGKKSDIPSESTFSRAFAEFSETQLPLRIHEALVKDNLSEAIVGHISRDSTEMEAREKSKRIAKVESDTIDVNVKRGRPGKGEERTEEPTRLELQQKQGLEEMLADLPTDCDVGTKKNSKGFKETWIGYKLHMDVADGQIPISLVLTSASLHDSQVALPLSEMSHRRVTSLYDLMDSAYDSVIIRENSKRLGHVPIIDINPRRNRKLKDELIAESKRLEILNLKRPEDVRYNERTAIERVNGRLKDEFGGRMLRVKGHAKVMTHLMFGILALTVDQLIRLMI
jgi:hypothetical protein